MGATVFHGQKRAICITDKYTRAVKIRCYTLIFFEIRDSGDALKTFYLLTNR